MKKILALLLTVFISYPAFGLNLNESLQIAYKQNPSILAAQKKVEALRGSLLQATGAFFPNLRVSASTGQTYQKPSEVQLETPVGPQRYVMGVDAQIPTRNLSFTLSQPLFTGGKLFSSLNIAQNNFKIASEDLRSKILSVNFDTTSAYLGLIKAQKLVDLSNQFYLMAKNHFDQAQTMFNVGISTKSDVLRSQVQLVNSEISLSKAKNGLVIAQNILNNVMGNPIGAQVVVDQSDFCATCPPPPSFETIIGAAYLYRPDWIEFQTTKEIAKNNVTIARSDLLPAVSAVGNYGTSYSQYPTYSTDVNTWSALLSASWDILDIRIPGRVQEAQANLEAQNANETALKNNIAMELKNAHLNLQLTIDTIASTQKAVDLAQENYKAATIRYGAGVATNLDVIDAESSLRQAQTDNLNAQFDMQVAKAKINQLVGKEIL